MAFRKKFEVVCDAESDDGLCNVVGTVFARSKAEANTALVKLGWHYYDMPPSCVHYCPAHASKP